MLRRIFAILLIVLGLGTIGAAIASGTVWRPDDRVTATLPQEPDVPLVVTAPGVLNVVNDHVRVRVVGASDDTPIVLAMGREADVRAWVGDALHLEVTGLTDWETLAVTDGTDSSATPTGDATDTATDGATDVPTDTATQEPTEAPSDAEPAVTVPNPSGSDLWVEEVDGTGELTYEWTAIEGRWMMLLASDGTAPAPQLELTWTREVTTPFVKPGIILGSVLLIVGAVLLVLQLLTDREARRAHRAATSGGGIEPASLPVLAEGEDGTVVPLTRRQIRAADEARREQERRARKPRGDLSGTDTSGTAVGALAAAGADDESDLAADDGTEPGTDLVTHDATTTDAAPGGPITETIPAVPASSGSSDLDDWVRSGRTAEHAAPIETYESTAPGSGFPVVPDAGSADSARAEAEAPRRGWWRALGKPAAGVMPGEERTGTQDATDVAAGTEGAIETDAPIRPTRRRWRPDSWAAPSIGAAAGSTPTSPVEPAEADGTASGDDVSTDENPQASGASWRRTWGLGSRGRTAEPGAAGPAGTDDASPADDRDEKEDK
ncbi:MAG: hypothetical protein JJE50_09125 [Actinomycetales bacterium]|nr:hypothetical protein [Actinomycetales bacterium]